MMEIVIDFPPIYDEIISVFPKAGCSVIFAWGNKIYNPNNDAGPKVTGGDYPLAWKHH